MVVNGGRVFDRGLPPSGLNCSTLPVLRPRCYDPGVTTPVLRARCYDPGVTTPGVTTPGVTTPGVTTKNRLRHLLALGNLVTALSLCSTTSSLMLAAQERTDFVYTLSSLKVESNNGSCKAWANKLDGQSGGAGLWWKQPIGYA